MENDWRLKQLMNTYTERSGATHVCSGQLLSELRERGTSEGLHRSKVFSLMHKRLFALSVTCNYTTPGALANILDRYRVYLTHSTTHTLTGPSLCVHVVQTTTA